MKRNQQGLINAWIKSADPRREHLKLLHIKYSPL